MTTSEGLNADFRDLLQALNEEQVEYVIVGAYALAFHGVPRATGDIDAFVRPSPENARRAWSALARFGAPLRMMGVREEDLATPGMVYQIGVPPRRIDVLTAISGVDFETVWGSRRVADLAGVQVPFISRAHLIQNKLATGRTKDLADVEALERTERP